LTTRRSEKVRKPKPPIKDYYCFCDVRERNKVGCRFRTTCENCPLRDPDESIISLDNEEASIVEQLVEREHWDD
jgi:hypothetical protein